MGSLLGQSEATVDKDGVLRVDDFKDLRGHVRQWKPIVLTDEDFADLKRNPQFSEQFSSLCQSKA